MFILKLHTKLINLAILTSFIGVQFAPMALAQDYQLVPPSNNLPTLNANNMYVPNTPLQGQVSVVPSGATFEAKMNTTIGSAINEVGDTFTATLTSPITSDGVEVVPAGSEAVGQITYINSAGRLGKNGIIEVQFTNVKLPYGSTIPIRAKINTIDKQGRLQGRSIAKQIVKSTATTAVMTGGGALFGLSLGAIVSSVGPATIVGTAAGGLVGLGYVVANKGREALVPADTKLTIILDEPLRVSK